MKPGEWRAARTHVRTVAIVVPLLACMCIHHAATAAPAECFDLDAARISPTSDSPDDLRAADLDGDGAVDFVVRRAYSGFVTVQLGNGDGTLRPPVAYAAGGDVGPPAIGDVTGDGVPDLLVPDRGSYDVMLLAGTGNGTFAAPVAIPMTVATTPIFLTLAHLNGDGYLDMAVTGSISSVTIFLGNGNGTFQPPTTYPAGFYGGQVAAADLDGDGDQDLAILTTSPEVVTAMKNNGDGTFQAPVSVYGTGREEALVLADLDGDGAAEAITANSDYQGGIFVYRNDGSGALQPPAHVAAGEYTDDLAIADLDGDGTADVFGAGYGGYGAFVLLGNGDTTFQPAVAYPVSGTSVAIADADGDGKLDVASLQDDGYVGRQSDGIAIARGNGDGTFQSSKDYDAGGRAQAVASSDFDGDGDADLALATMVGLSVLLGNGDGSFSPPVLLLPGASIMDVAAADLDGDGASDLIAADLNDQVAVLLGRGDGTFSSPLDAPTGYRPAALAMADLDGDGLLDAIATTDQSGLAVLLGKGDGTFQNATHVRAGRYSWFNSIACADLNEDGAPDVAMVDNGLGSGGIYVLFGDGSGGFQGQDYVDIPSYAFGVAIADVDADGSNDLVAATASGVSIALSTGTGTFQTPVLYPSREVDRALATDMDGDGVLDLVATGAGVAVELTGVGSGMFQPARAYAAGWSIDGVLAADVDGNGSPDLVASDWTGRADIVLSKAPGIAPPALPDGSVGVPYLQPLIASGVTPPVSFTLQPGSGTLPPGLSLSSAGVIAGTPTASGHFAFTVLVTDGRGCGARRAYVITVNGSGCTAIDIAPPMLPRGFLGWPYGVILGASGGASPYGFTVAAGALPPGLTLGSSGVLSGVPVATGDFSFVVVATDANGCVGVAPRTLRIATSNSRIADYLVGQGAGQPNSNRVRVFDESGVATGTDFLAYAAGSWGTRVAGSDLTRNGPEQILTGPGPGTAHGPQVRAFDVTGSAVTKVNFFAYGTLHYGVNPAGGDLDDDSYDEIVTGAGPGAVFGPHVRGWDFDGASLSPMPGLSFFAYGTLHYGVNVAASPLEGTGASRILTGPGPSPAFAGVVRGFRYQGAAVAAMAKVNFAAFTTHFGVVVSGGDVDADGFGEILAAPGPGTGNAPLFAGFDYDATRVSPLPGFSIAPYGSAAYGGRVGSSDVTRDGRDDLLCGSGPDPAAAATMYAFDYAGGALAPVAGTPILAFPGTFGVDVAGARLGL